MHGLTSVSQCAWECVGVSGCVQGVLCQCMHAFLPNLPNFVMIQSAPHLPLAAGIEQTKKAKKKKHQLISDASHSFINAPQMLMQLCTHTGNSLRAGIMLPTHAFNAEVNDTANTIKKIITAPAR